MPGNQRPGSDVRGGALGDPRDMVKAVLLEVQSPAMELRILRNDVWNRCPRPAAALKHSCRNLQDPGATPSEGVKEMSGPPTSRFHVWRRRTWDRLRDASPMATEAP
jgi:hypothetical protein